MNIVLPIAYTYSILHYTYGILRKQRRRYQGQMCLCECKRDLENHIFHSVGNMEAFAMERKKSTCHSVVLDIRNTIT